MLSFYLITYLIHCASLALEEAHAQRQAYLAQYRDEHRAQRQAYTAQYQREHPEKGRARSKKYAAEHPEKGRAYNAAHLAERRLASHKQKIAHPEKVRAYTAASRARHRETYLARTRAWREAHRAEIRAYSAAYRREHPEVKRASEAKRRARKRGATQQDFTAEEWQTMKEHYGHRCVYCGRKMQRLTMDHLTPLSQGGAHTKNNIVPACLSCNSRKQAGPPLKPVQPLLL